MDFLKALVKAAKDSDDKEVDRKLLEARMNDKSLCIHCHAWKREQACLPCGHVVFCHHCFGNLVRDESVRHKCPECKCILAHHDDTTVTISIHEDKVKQVKEGEEEKPDWKCQAKLFGCVFEPQPQPQLPKGWETQIDSYGQTYYIDHNTKTTTFNHPTSNASLPPGWEMRLDSNGKFFFIDHHYKRTTYDDPRTAPLALFKPPPHAPKQFATLHFSDRGEWDICGNCLRQVVLVGETWNCLKCKLNNGVNMSECFNCKNTKKDNDELKAKLEAESRQQFLEAVAHRNSLPRYWQCKRCGLANIERSRYLNCPSCGLGDY